jgi:hypothetical protein
MRTVEQLMAEADAYIAKAKAKKGWLKQIPFAQRAMDIIEDAQKQYPDSIILEICRLELTLWYYPIQYAYKEKYEWRRAIAYVDSKTGLTKEVDKAYIQGLKDRVEENMADFRSQLAEAQARLKEVSK